MNRHRLIPTALVCFVAILSSGCNKDEGKAGSAPPAKGHHIKRSIGTCTFELDAPEPIPEDKGAGGPTSFTLKSKSLQVFGYQGVTLYRKALDLSRSYPSSFQEIARNDSHQGLVLAAVFDPKADKSDATAVRVSIGERYQDKRPLGCSMACWGPKSRQSEVIEMCKSVKISSTDK